MTPRLVHVQVEVQAALLRIGIVVGKGAVMPGLITGHRRLHLYHVRTQVGQQLRGERSGDHVPKLDDPHSIQRLCSHFPGRGTSLSWRIRTS